MAIESEHNSIGSPSSEESGRKRGERIRTSVQAPPPEPFDQRIKRVRRALNALIIAAIAMIVAIGVAPVEECYTAKGRVQPAHYRYLFAPTQATISEVLVHEGDHVTTGQTLLRFDMPDMTREILEKEEQIHNLQANLDAETAHYTALEQLPLPKDMWEMSDQLAQTRKQMEFSSSSLERYKRLAKEGVASVQEVERTQLQYDQARIDHERLSKRLEILGKGYEGNLLNEAKAKEKQIRVDLQGAQEVLAYLKDRFQQYSELKAKEEGFILNILHDEGELVPRGQQLIYMNTSQRQRVVRINGGQKDIDRISAGQRVRYKSAIYNPLLSDYSYGAVVEVSQVRETDEASAPSAGPQEYTIYASIDEEPQGQELKLDSDVTAQIILRRDRLYKVIFGMDKPGAR